MRYSITVYPATACEGCNRVISLSDYEGETCLACFGIVAPYVVIRIVKNENYGIVTNVSAAKVAALLNLIEVVRINVCCKRSAGVNLRADGRKSYDRFSNRELIILILGGIPVISLSALNSCTESVLTCLGGNGLCISGVILTIKLIFVNYRSVICGRIRSILTIVVFKVGPSNNTET